MTPIGPWLSAVVLLVCGFGCHPGWEIRSTMAGKGPWDLACVASMLDQAPGVTGLRAIKGGSASEVQFSTTGQVGGGFFVDRAEPNVLFGYLSGAGSAPPPGTYDVLEARLQGLARRVSSGCSPSQVIGEVSCVTYGIWQPKFCP